MTTTLFALASTPSLRNANLEDLVALLRSQADIRYDVVTTAAALRYQNGLLAIDGGAARVTDDGVEEADALLSPTQGCEDQVADRLDIPSRYVRRMRSEMIEQGEKHQPGSDPSFIAELLDHNVNHWLRSQPNRKFLIRGLRSDDPDSIGIARAFLSDRFGAIDHLDVVLAALDGVRQAGVEVEIVGCDLSERRMQVRIQAPGVIALAPELLKNYRSPFRSGGLNRAGGFGMGYEPGEEPIVFAGFVISNSETGGGAFTITPRIVVKICTNGLTIKADALREIHLGGTLDEGVIRWSDETNRKAAELISAKTRDAVTSYLDRSYVEHVVGVLEQKAEAPVTEPVKVIERLGKQLRFSQEEQDSILSAFVAGGQTTAGGMMQAVSAAAQMVDDPDRAADLEAAAVDALDFAAAAA